MGPHRRRPGEARSDRLFYGNVSAKPESLAMGTYDDVLVRRPDGWKLWRRHVTHGAQTPVVRLTLTSGGERTHRVRVAVESHSDWWKCPETWFNSSRWMTSSVGVEEPAVGADGASSRQRSSPDLSTAATLDTSVYNCADRQTTKAIDEGNPWRQAGIERYLGPKVSAPIESIHLRGID